MTTTTTAPGTSTGTATTPAVATAEVLLHRVATIEPILRDNAARAEDARRLPDASVHAMREAGLYAMSIPQALGGLELDPISTFRVLEEVARIDGATGWNLQLSVGASTLGAWLPDEGAREVFGPDTIMAGTLSPLQAVPAAGGYRVTGHIPFISGCHNATWVLAPAQVASSDNAAANDAPKLRLVFFPRTEAEIVDNWDTLGLRGTGSHDLAVHDIFIPTHRTASFVPRTAPAGTAFAGPLYRFTIWLAVAGLATPALGVAQAAIQDLLDLAAQKTPAYTGVPLRERVMAQSQLAQAQAQLGAARAYLHEALDEAWQAALAGEALTVAHRMKLQLAACHAAQEAADVVRLVHSIAGTSAIRRSHRFERYFRDVHTNTQHAFISPSRWESVGRWMYGLQPDWPFLAY
jgi:alkylation response protein AidB-like acyl-CoA dehydrogenase